jgi:hypothetical protein
MKPSLYARFANSFKQQCIAYLLSNGWEQDVDGWAWVYRQNFARRARTDSTGVALEIQMGWDDDGPN